MSNTTEAPSNSAPISDENRQSAAPNRATFRRRRVAAGLTASAILLTGAHFGGETAAFVAKPVVKTVEDAGNAFAHGWDKFGEQTQAAANKEAVKEYGPATGKPYKQYVVGDGENEVNAWTIAEHAFPGADPRNVLRAMAQQLPVDENGHRTDINEVSNGTAFRLAANAEGGVLVTPPPAHTSTSINP